MKETPVLLLTGYLGSGKTTLLNNILRNKEGIRFAVIVNDIGEINIDADLIAKGGIVGKKDESLVALQNGCICCTLRMDLVEQIEEIMAREAFDYIVIEASGICEPAPIAQTICSIPTLGPKSVAHGIPRLDAVVTVVDALRMVDEFGCGDALTAGNIGDEDLERLVIEQIEFCNIVLLNKASEVTAAQLERLRKVVKALNPGAEIIPCDYCDVPLDKLLNTHRFEFGRVEAQAGWVQGVEAAMSADEEREARADHHEHHHHHDHEDEHHEHHEHDGHDHNCESHHGGECTCGHHHHHCEGGEVEEYGIQTMVYYRRKPFDFEKFDDMIARRWPKNIIRCKGVLYFSNMPDMSVLFEQAGRQKKVTQAGYWYATAPEEDIERLMQMDPQFMRDWDPLYGDRMIKLVVIGQHLDREKITALFDSCLV